METEYARIFEDGWRERKGSLTFSCEEIGLALAKDEVRESFFTVSGSEGEPVEGYVSCQEERATCLTSFFQAHRNRSLTASTPAACGRERKEGGSF